MSVKSLDTEMLRYWPLLEMDEKQSILTFMKSFLKHKVAPIPLTIEQYNRELDEAEARMDAGQFTSLEDAIKQAESWW